MGDLPKIEQLILELSQAERYQLDTWLHEVLRIEQLKLDRETKQFMEHQAGLGITYELEYIKCGKKNCKCNGGQGHGPYWYAYKTVKGKLRKKYIGKSLNKINGKKV